jgi:hypothetical protein
MSIQWLDHGHILSMATSAQPAVCSFNDTLLCVYRSDNGSTLYWATLDESGWKDQGRLMRWSCSSGPTLAATSTTLYLAYKDSQGPAIYLSTFTATDGWKNLGPIPGQLTGDSPQVAVQDDRLFMVYPDSNLDNRNIYYGFLEDDGETWTWGQLPDQKGLPGLGLCGAGVTPDALLFMTYRGIAASPGLWFNVVSAVGYWKAD